MVTMYRHFICLSLERQNSEAVFTTTATPSTFCIYEEQTFQAGDIFNTIDGCNSCNCTLDGEVKCTQRRCPLNIGKLVTVIIISVVVKILKRYSFVNIYYMRVIAQRNNEAENGIVETTSKADYIYFVLMPSHHSLLRYYDRLLYAVSLHEMGIHNSPQLPVFADLSKTTNTCYLS